MNNEQLVAAYQAGDVAAIDELMKKNKGLIKFFANRYVGVAKHASLEYTDLEQEGWIAFIDAVEKYPSSNENEYSFSTFAGYKIKYQILRSVNKLMHRTKKSDLSSEIIKVGSLSDLIPGTEDIRVEDSIEDENAEWEFMLAEDKIDNALLREDIYFIIDSVFGKETKFNGFDLCGVDVNSLYEQTLNGISGRDILIQHYGLEGDPKTLSEIAKKAGCSYQNINRLENQSFRKIKDSEVGIEFVKKYRWAAFNIVDSEKDKVDCFSSPESIIEKFELLDDLLYGILNQCG